LRRTGLREARFSAGVVKQKARMNAVHRVFIGFPATPSSGVHSRREARVIPCASRIHPRYSAPRASGLVQFRNSIPKLY
jgi:hypothetical protein